jgi:hypothetical protein
VACRPGAMQLYNEVFDELHARIWVGRAVCLPFPSRACTHASQPRARACMRGQT